MLNTVVVWDPFNPRRFGGHMGAVHSLYSVIYVYTYYLGMDAQDQFKAFTTWRIYIYNMWWRLTTKETGNDKVVIWGWKGDDYHWLVFYKDKNLVKLCLNVPLEKAHESSTDNHTEEIENHHSISGCSLQLCSVVKVR